MSKLPEDGLSWQSQLSDHSAQCRQGAGEVWACFQDWGWEGEGQQANGKEAEEGGHRTGLCSAHFYSTVFAPARALFSLLPGRLLYWALNRGPTVVWSLAF